MTVHQVNLEMGDSVNIEVFQTTSVERRNVASLNVQTPGLIEITVERHEEDLPVVTSVE